MRSAVSSSLRIECTDFEPGGVLYTLSGDVNETFKAESLQPKDKKHIVYDLAGIENFNSIGIREWSTCLASLAKDGVDVRFRNCSVVMMDQFNLVPESLGEGLIESFYAPYFCQDHGEINELLNYADIGSELLSRIPPKRLCPHCQKLMDFDALAESYFQFHEHITRR
jgi:eukaryotic-like serine/threonine-protein kinase